MNKLKSLLFRSFISMVKPLWGKGLGNIKFIGAAYNYLYRLLAVDELTLQIPGNRIIVRSLHSDGISRELLFRGDYEKFETQLFCRMVSQGMTVVDVGANIGYYTLLAARLAGKAGRVYSFEPESANYTLLLRNIEANGLTNVIPVRKAVSASTGQACLFLNRQTGAHGLLSNREDVIGNVMVETVSLDEYFQGRESPIDIIKLDVEGAEIAALAGMPNIIKANASLKIFTEFWPWELKQINHSPQKYWDGLVDSGFNCIYLINENKQRLELTCLDAVLAYCRDTSLAKLPSANLICSRQTLL